ncbi:sensor histidine kinase [Cryptosporangium sp. NPDC048952]|uniref:sensor histidine kinase n=1 Tax=Cryptosporangium sp. NPDC048952 TaxID=3363961 RepID=UPI00371FA67B
MRKTQVLAVGAVTVLTGMDVWWNPPGTPEPGALGFILVAVSAAALLVRHSWPLPTLLVCAAAFTTWSLTDYHGESLWVPTAVALYTVAAQRRVLVIGASTVVWSAALQWTAEPSSAPMTAVAWPVVALLLGEVVRSRRELQHEQAAREARLVAEREQEADRRIARERMRIAHEVHDVVAHVMAGVTVQMGVAVAAVERRPEVARAALQQARAASRSALTELRTAVALLRDDGSDATAGPPPDLASLSELVEGVRSPSLTTELQRHSDATPLPAVLELTVYRIVQEALTNVVRHANASSATVVVRRDGDTLVVEVTDNGVGCADPPPTTGFGLRGMTERVTATGGHLTTAPAPNGGFRVRATFPLEATRVGGSDGADCVG